jgi:hypothetical protein
MTQVVVARMVPQAVAVEDLAVSVVIPCKTRKETLRMPFAAFRLWRLGQRSFSVTINRLTSRSRNETSAGPPATAVSGMLSRDAISLYDLVGRGAEVTIVDAPLYTMLPSLMQADSKAQPHEVAFVDR